MKDLIIRHELCMSCRSCEIACAVEHSKSKNLISALGENPAPKRRIHVECSPYLEISIPVTCRQCENAPCASACPTRALSQDEATGIVNYNKDLCVDCWTCSKVCTRFSPLYHLILSIGCWSSSMASNREVISRQVEAGLKCDLCEGKELPACVEACPTHALIFFDAEMPVGQ